MPDGAGTRLLLEHRELEEHGEVGRRMRSEYDPGWDQVLDALGRTTGAVATTP